ncbi:hypothetical protein, partial [Chamaesiphon sp. VAR_48_metabat_135_sub]|uniref:hypothetical protein n=1 Tax=Chamaesiphon sp. VAR_48_metabat_135_sub TaxID=2964699 RepID=UPI00286D4AED
MENRQGEQLQPHSNIPNLLPVEQHDPLTLLPLQPQPTLAPLNHPTDRQILSIVTGDNPNDTFQHLSGFKDLRIDRINQLVLSPLPLTLSPQHPSDTLNPTPDTLRSAQPLTLEQLSRVESTAVNLWQSLLPDHRQLDVNFEITDLANGEIAHAQVTKFSPTGLATGGTILIDRSAQGAGWFVDAT